MRFVCAILVMTLVIGSCNRQGVDAYSRLKSQELSSGKRVDSIFFGIRFGMTSKEFYAHCWEMNKKGLFTDGENNTAVLYKLNKGELKYPALMNFYPDFRDNKIYKVTTTFQYEAWAPWNKERFSDSLIIDLTRLYDKWYKEGNPFIVIQDKKKGTIYVKVDGNRRITIGRFDDMHVRVDYTDLLTEQQLSKK